MNAVPRIVRIFALIVAVLGAITACSSEEPDAPGTGATASAPGGGARSGGGGARSGGGRPPSLVVAGSVEEHLINDRLKAVGTGSARSSVSVVPLTGGIITEILATPGQQVKVNDTLATLDNEEQQIAYEDSRIEEDSRTLPVKALIDNTNDKLRPGMSFELELEFPGQQYPGVDPLAIQWDSDGSFVWKIDEGSVLRVPATIIQRNRGSVLIDAELQPGDRVVTEGVMSLRQGAKIRIQGEPRPERQNDSGSSGKSDTPTTAEAKPASGSTGS